MNPNGRVVWFTGLSGSGKTTLSTGVEERLKAAGFPVECLDGEIIRQNLSKGLGFSREDRIEHLYRIAFVAEVLARHGVIVLVAAISPYRATRDAIRQRLGAHFTEVYVNAPLAVCEARDVKGLYRKARAGLIPAFTGIDDPYEPPLYPEVECRTDTETVGESVRKVLGFLNPALAR